GVYREAGCNGVVLKIISALVSVKCVGIVGKICLEDVEQAVAIKIARGPSHSRLFPAVFVVGDTGSNANLLESLSTKVVVVQAGGRIAGHEDVRPPVVVKVSGQGGEPVVVLGAGDVNAVGNVGKVPVPVVFIKRHGLRRQPSRAAQNGTPLPLALCLFPRMRRVSHIELDVVDNYKIKKPIAVKIDESAACAPAWLGRKQAAFFGFVAKRAISLVPV